MNNILAEPLGHGYCLLWNPRLLWTHVLSDAAIAIAYYSIALGLLMLLRKRKNTPFKAVFGLFAAFILLCGTTHALDIVSIWRPIYDITGFTKAITAAVSLATVVAFAKVVPRMIRVPDPYSDESTSLPNRTLLLDRIEQASNRTKRSGQGFTVIFVRCAFTYPLDPLKAEILRPVVLGCIAEELKAAVRSVDTVGLGEDNEFVILAEGIDRTIGLDVLLTRIVEVLSRPTRVGSDRVAVESRVSTVVSDGTIPALTLLADSPRTTEPGHAFALAGEHLRP